MSDYFKAELGEHLAEGAERQTHYIEEISVDALNEYGGNALSAICARLVQGFAGGDIAEYLVLAERAEKYVGGLVAAESFFSENEHYT